MAIAQILENRLRLGTVDPGNRGERTQRVESLCGITPELGLKNWMDLIPIAIEQPVDQG
jgi:hypothetical protein